MDAKKTVDKNIPIQVQCDNFSLDFGYNSYRKKEALDVLVLGYRSVLDTSGGAPASAHGRS
jgi:hypothetical protein